MLGDISDAWSVVTRAAEGTNKYIVLYDDFLGTFRFDEAKFAKNEDTSLMRFVEKCRNTQNIRFILTTRELVLADARRLHGAFERQADDLAKCTILLEDYARANRARVLFNHLYFSDLSDSRLEMLVSHRVYRDIVGHEHFNPRTVETISRAANSASLTDEDYCEYVRGKFDDPSELWEHPFENQISPVARQILAVLWSFSGAVDLSTLKEALFAFAGDDALPDLSIKFRSSMKELTGNFVSCNYHENAVSSRSAVIYVTFQNPSIQEFVERFLTRENSWTDRIAASITHFRQAERLESWANPYTNQHRHGSVVSKRFFGLLHSRAAHAEHRVAGEIHRFVGSDIPKFLESDLKNPVERAHVLLKIADAAEASDARAQELWSRVTTASGWTVLLAEVSQNPSIARATKRLLDWLHRFTEDERRKLLTESFRAVLADILSSNESWDAGLRPLADLDACVALVMEDVPEQHAENVRRLVEQVSDDLLDHENDAQRMDEEASALIQLNQRIQVRPRLLERLQERVSELHQDETESGTAGSVPASYSAQSQEDNFDLDKMFTSLMDR